MRIVMKGNISGTRDGIEWPPVGGVCDVSDDEATQLIGAGFAVEAPAEKKPVEKATAVPAGEKRTR
jgi:hypothetical protein